ncbi:probable endonuclease 4 [Diadema antillarum]|uniref:probable endonuclease 4 n=1 Tax=Diadema antillarum TaxID=105358 RepID=UPI003A849056
MQLRKRKGPAAVEVVKVKKEPQISSKIREGRASDSSAKVGRGRGKQQIKTESAAVGEEPEQALPAGRKQGRRKGVVKEEETDAGKLVAMEKQDSSKPTQGQTGRGKRRGAKKVKETDVPPREVTVKTETEANEVRAPLVNTGCNGGKFVGAHCSIAGGIWKAVQEAVSIGAKSFALFLCSQRQWQTKPLQVDAAAQFREACADHGFPSHLILPHGSYLLNCGSPNPDTLAKSRELLAGEFARCEKLGLTLYNFHPGSTCGVDSVEECLDKIGESINMALEKSSGVTAVIENMSCQGNTVGGQFEELRGIIDRVKDKKRIGVCLDTCHAFAAGYDLSQEVGFQKMMVDFDRVVGFQYLKGLHLNDSKGEVGCHLDRHENIGEGKIGLAGFRRIMNDPRFNNIPLILETPPELGYAKEIKLLNSLME